MRMRSGREEHSKNSLKRDKSKNNKKKKSGYESSESDTGEAGQSKKSGYDSLNSDVCDEGHSEHQAMIAQTQTQMRPISRKK